MPQIWNCGNNLWTRGDMANNKISNWDIQKKNVKDCKFLLVILNSLINLNE